MENFKFMVMFMCFLGMCIEGGIDEIFKNIIVECVLQFLGDICVDCDVLFSEILSGSVN